jgi:hypothetical protein
MEQREFFFSKENTERGRFCKVGLREEEKIWGSCMGLPSLPPSLLLSTI